MSKFTKSLGQLLKKGRVTDQEETPTGRRPKQPRLKRRRQPKSLTLEDTAEQIARQQERELLESSELRIPQTWMTRQVPITSIQELREEMKQTSQKEAEVMEEIGDEANTAQFAKEYNKIVRDQIAKNLNISPDAVTEDQITEELTIRKNLPIMIFLVNYIVDQSISIDQYDVPSQFKRMFTALSQTQRNSFLNQLFSVYPLEEFMYGPNDRYILDLLIFFCNKQTELKFGDTDTRLATEKGEAFIDSVKSFDKIQLLLYRNIVFNKLSSLLFESDRILKRGTAMTLAQTQISTILKMYNQFLIDKNSFLAMIRKTTESVAETPSLYIAVLKSKTSTNFKAPTIIDFSVPIDNTEAIKNIINKYIAENIRQIVRLAKLTSSDITTAEINGLNIVLYLFDKLDNVFNAILPREQEFKDYINSTLTDQLAKYFAEIKADDNIVNLNVSLPDSIADKLLARLESIKDVELGKISAQFLQQQAAKLNIPLSSFVNDKQTYKAAKAKLKQKYKAKLITKEEYKNLKDEIKHVIKEYNNLLEQQESAKWTAPGYKKSRREFNKKLEEANKIYEERLKEQLAGVFDSDDIEKIKKDLKAQVYQEEDISAQELRDYLLPATARTRKNVLDMTKFIQNMPDALKQSVYNTMEKLAEPVEMMAKDNSFKEYYHFITKVIIINWNLRNNPDIVQQLSILEQEYAEKLPVQFIRKILEMLKNPNVTGQDLFSYVSVFTKQKIKLLKNPLVRQTKRREKRMRTLEGEKIGELTKIGTLVPGNLQPVEKDCLLPHILKPWMNLKNPLDWTTWIALSSGKSRTDMSASDRVYFEPMDELLVVMLDGTVLHFYRPTNSYWYNHCSIHHAKNDSSGIRCNASSLISDLTPGKDIKFYELLLAEHTKRIEYTGDTDKIKFISLDPRNYQKECDWYKYQYQQIDISVTQFRNEQMTGSVETGIRQIARNEIKAALTNLRLRLGLEGNGLALEDIDINTVSLEDIIFSSAKFTVYEYLKQVFLFLIFLDTSDKVGSNALFFQGLIAQSSRAYYPMIFKWFPSMQTRYPELFMSGEDSDLKLSVAKYINNKTNLLIDQTIYKYLESKHPKVLNLSGLFEKQMGELNNVLIGPLRYSLKNICKNKDMYANIPNEWLMYYKIDHDIYCISKLELSAMAKSKNYKFGDVQFNPDFVNDYYNYTEYAAGEIKLRNIYLGAIQKLFQEPKFQQLFDQLVDKKLVFGEIEIGDVLQTGLIQRLEQNISNAPLIIYLTGQINNIIDMYVFDQIINMANAFIKSNKELIKRMIDDAYASNNGLIDRDAEIQPVIDAIARHIVELKPTFTVGKRESQVIASLVYNYLASSDMPQYETSQNMLTPTCDVCKSIISSNALGSYSTVVQQGKDSAKWKTLKFCSDNCMIKNKVEDPNKDQATKLRLQGDVLILTGQYLTYNEMVFWAKFPKVNRTISMEDINNIAKIKGMDISEIRNTLERLSDSDYALGILTFDESGKALSGTELWDRIRIHPNFVPAIDEMLTEEKMDALRHLAKEYNVPVFGSDVQESIIYYTDNPIELRTLWKGLRSNKNFEAILYSTVTSFDPYSKTLQKAPSNLTSSELIDYTIHLGTSQIQKIETKNISVWISVETILKGFFNSVGNLADYIMLDTRFKRIRDEGFELVKKKHPGLIPDVDPKQRSDLIATKRTLEIWFKNHLQAITQSVPVVLKYSGDAENGTISFEEMLMFLTQYCMVGKNLKTLSQLTFDIIKSNPDIEAVVQSGWVKKIGEKESIQAKTGYSFFFTVFYPEILNKLDCKYLTNIDIRYGEALFAIEKINNIMDDVIAQTIDEQERAAVQQQKPFKSFASAARWGKKTEKIESIKETAKVQKEEPVETRSRIEILKEQLRAKRKAMKKSARPRETLSPDRPVTTNQQVATAIDDFIKDQEVIDEVEETVEEKPEERQVYDDDYYEGLQDEY